MAGHGVAVLQSFCMCGGQHELFWPMLVVCCFMLDARVLSTFCIAQQISLRALFDYRTLKCIHHKTWRVKACGMTDLLQ